MAICTRTMVRRVGWLNSYGCTGRRARYRSPRLVRPAFENVPTILRRVAREAQRLDPLVPVAVVLAFLAVGLSVPYVGLGVVALPLGLLTLSALATSVRVRAVFVVFGGIIAFQSTEGLSV